MLGIGGDGTASYIQSFNTQPLQLNSFANNVLLTSNGVGKVGIGTETPLEQLHVSTNAGAGGMIIQSRYPLSAGSGSFLRIYNSGTPTAVNQRLGGVLFGANPSGSTLRTGVQIEAFSEGAWTDGVSYPTFLRFMTTKANTATL